MGKIKILSEQLQNQISAGEVVERPASVVKELVENALDAGSTKVEIELQQAGKNEITVIDNGEGMNEEDLLHSIKRYATSKIYSEQDLWDIQTMGFRGEALASICSVSEVTIQSKQDGSQEGLELRMRPHLTAPEMQIVGCPQGTKVTVKNLFLDTPARLKFLKTDSTELHHIMDTVEQLILIHPEVEWSLSHNGKNVYNFPRAEGSEQEQLKQQIQRLLAIKNEQDLAELSYDSPIMEIRGFIGSPKIARRNRKHQYLFINKRPIKNHMVSKAVLDGFHSCLPHGLYPFFVMNIEITRDLVDVNVHPRKQEVRFINQQQIFTAIKAAVEQSIKKMDLINQYESPAPVSSTPSFQPSYKAPSYSTTPNTCNFQSPSKASSQQALEFTHALLTPVKDTVTVDRVVGQLHNAYMVVEKEDGMLILDQHAVHERIRYEKLKKAAEGKLQLGQKLLLPEVVEVSASDAEILKHSLPVLTPMGFEIQEQSETSFQVSSIPSFLEGGDLTKIVKELIDDLRNIDQKTESLEKITERSILYLSCRGSIKFGDRITHTELQYLYQEWLSCEKKETCPHGRPLSYFIPYQTLNKQFDR